METPFFPIQSQWERSRANNSVVKSSTRPKFELIRDFIPARLTHIRLKVTEKTRIRDVVFPILCQWELSVAMVTTVLI